MPSVQAAQRYASKQVIEIDLQYYGKDQEKKNQKTYCSSIVGKSVKAQNKSFDNSSTQDRGLCKKQYTISCYFNSLYLS